MGKPPVAAALRWQGDLRFSTSSKGGEMILDGDAKAGPSPMEALALSLAACMAIDVVDIINKGRHPLRGLDAHIVGERADATPSVYIRLTLRFLLRGDVPAPAIERAIALSRDKYCSVWHSLRPDIEFLTSYEVTP